jgi:hypothetical protein
MAFLGGAFCADVTPSGLLTRPRAKRVLPRSDLLGIVRVRPVAALFEKDDLRRRKSVALSLRVMRRDIRVRVAPDDENGAGPRTPATVGSLRLGVGEDVVRCLPVGVLVGVAEARYP